MGSSFLYHYLLILVDIIIVVTGIGILDKLIVLVNTLGFVGVLGVFIYTNMIDAPIDPAEEKFVKKLEEVKAKDKGKVGFIAHLGWKKDNDFFKLEKISFNLPYSNQRLRFINLTVEIEPTKSKYKDEIKLQETYLKDAIITLGSKMQPKELNTRIGKLVFAKRLKSKMNSYFSFPVIKEVYFSRFIID